METAFAQPCSELPRFENFGGIREFQTDRLKALRRLVAERRPLVQVRGLAGRIVLASSPDAVHEVLVEKARFFEKSPVLRMALYPLAGQGLFTSEGELWKRQRKLMAPIFQVSQIKHFAACMGECAAQVCATWQDGATVDIARETTHVAMNIAGRTLFDVDLSGDADEIGEALTVALEWTGEQSGAVLLFVQARLRTLLLNAKGVAPAAWGAKIDDAAAALLRPAMVPGKKTRELKHAIGVLEERVTRMIAERRRSTEPKSDLLSRLLAARDEDDGATMSDRQVRDEVLTLFVAGHETTATSLAWAVMLLCQHPEAYARARAEACALEHVPGYGDLPALGYCLRVFKEVMRLYPPVYLFGRQAMADVEIGGFALPKGTIVLASPFAMHHRPDLWPEPSRFDPDRFAPEAEAQRHKAAFFPFSLGPRTCIGNHFALMEGPIVLATLLRHADFELVDPRGSEPDPQATLRPKGGIPVRVKLRAKAAS